MTKLVSPGQKVQQLASKALEDLDTLHGEITNQRQALETKIKARIRLIHEALEARQEELIAQLDQMTQQKLKNIAAQLELLTTHLHSCCGYLRESPRAGSQAMVESNVLQVPDIPFVEANLEFCSSQTELTQACQQFGDIAVHPVCHAEGPGLHVAMVGEAATATVYVVDKEGREYHCPVEVSCELVSSDGSGQVRGEAKRVRDSQYEISYHPQHRGQHYLHIRVEDKHISGSPFPLSVLNTTPSNIIEDLKDPRGVAVNQEGQIVVVECKNNCISVLAVSGERRPQFRIGTKGSDPGQLQCPRGLAITAEGNYLVCDSGNNRIQLFSPEGDLLNCVGSEGSDPLQFNLPMWVSVHPQSNKVYVSDSDNHRVQILNTDLIFSSTFGHQGAGNGEFDRPNAICFDSTGNVYVVDSINHRIQVFTAEGQYLRQFGKDGSRGGGLNYPVGLAIDSNGLVYVSDRINNCILVFTQEGGFLTSFGTKGNGPGQFHDPMQVAIGRDGQCLVTGDINNRLQIF